MLIVHATVPERRLDVRLSVAAGEVLALLGPNGAGKSTVLAVIAGLLRPATGEVVLGERVLTRIGGGGETRGARAWVPAHARSVGLLAQDALLFPHLSVLDNVAFGPRCTGRSRAAAQEAARRWLGEVGVEELAGRRPRELSGGQAQRVALARALATEPRALLLDEPMAALDVAAVPPLRQTLKRLLAGRTAVVVTHDPLDALLLADRVAVLDDGRVVEEGPSRTVLTRPRSAFAARLAGLNLVTGRWRSGAVVSPTGLRVQGHAADAAPTEGSGAAAAFRPGSVSVFRTPPGGSPRNVLPVTVTALEPHGEVVRVRAGDLSADVTPAAVAELGLEPGERVLFTVKATDVEVYGDAGG